MAAGILVISSDKSLVSVVRQAGHEIGADVSSADGVSTGMERVSAERPDVVVCSHAVFDALHADFPNLCILLHSDAADSEQAISAVRRGAVGFLSAPFDKAEIARRLTEALRISRDLRIPAVYEEPVERSGVDHIIGQSPVMHEMFRLIGHIAPRDVNVLITGESGTGKEMVARAVLHHSARRSQPFLAVNCAAIPETLLESELFGHEKGAFTGAVRRHLGKFEQCHMGTLFLDEIGDMPLTTQAKLLRVLQDGTFQRLGSTEVVACDVRILAATHQPLERLIEQKKFREDLYYRLKVAVIPVPSLREREVDAVLLAHHFVRRFNADLGTRIRTMSPEVLPILLNYPWPGNVRELENTIKASLVMARGSVFLPEYLPEHVRDANARRAQRVTAPASSVEEDARRVARAVVRDRRSDGSAHERAVSLMEREIIRAALELTEGRVAPAARWLGISRTTLRKKMEQFSIRRSLSVDIGDDVDSGHP